MATPEQPLTAVDASGASLSAVRELVSRHALLILVALAAVVRFATLGVPSYWFDESLTVNETRQGLFDMFRAIRGVEVNPPLYFVVAWAWQRVLGDGEIALRSLSALLGTATVPRRLRGHPGARLAPRRPAGGGAHGHQPAPHLVLAGGAHVPAAGLPDGALLHVLRLRP